MRWRTDRGAQQTTTTRHDNNHSTCNNASKSWPSDVPIIMPGWEHHMGGVRSEPTVNPCLVRQGGCGWLHSTALNRCTNEPNSPTFFVFFFFFLQKITFFFFFEEIHVIFSFFHFFHYSFFYHFFILKFFQFLFVFFLPKGPSTLKKNNVSSHKNMNLRHDSG